MAAADPEDGRPEWSRLMAAAQNGDVVAYEHLLRDITPLLRKAAARRLYQAATADIEDVVQDVLLSVHAVRHTYDPTRPFLPWLMAIHRHRVADWQRRSMRQTGKEVAVESLEETFAGRAANTDDEEAPGRSEVRAAVAGLPPAQRKAIELLKLKGMSLKEAGKETGMTETALKVAAHRGVKALRALLRRSG